MKLILSVIVAVAIIKLIQYVYKNCWSKNLSVNIRFMKNILYANEENELYEVITNKKRILLPILQVKFAITKFFQFAEEENSSVTDMYYRNEFFTVMPYQKITRTYRFKCIRRGVFTMKDLDLICYSLFLNQKYISTFNYEDTVYVLPAKIRRENIPIMITRYMGELERNVHINDDPFTFAGIREYRPYDNIHDINWKISAKMDSYYVNIHNTTYSKNVTILLNLEPNSLSDGEYVIEYCISIAAHISAHLIKAQIPVAFYTNGFDIENEALPDFKHLASQSHLRNIEIALSRLDISIMPSPFEELLNNNEILDKKESEYIIISNSTKENVASAYNKKTSEGYHLLFVNPRYDNSTQQNIPGIIKWVIEKK